MIKSIIMFVIFFVTDLALIAFIESTNGALYLFLAAIFLEIAIYGSFIIYEISKLKETTKQGDKKDD